MQYKQAFTESKSKSSRCFKLLHMSEEKRRKNHTCLSNHEIKAFTEVKTSETAESTVVETRSCLIFSE